MCGCEKRENKCGCEEKRRPCEKKCVEKHRPCEKKCVEICRPCEKKCEKRVDHCNKYTGANSFCGKNINCYHFANKQFASKAKYIQYYHHI